MLVVKANIGESKESFRFQTLALDNLRQQLKKKKLKALIPQLVQALCVGGLLVLCVCSVVVSRNSYDCSNLFSFITALMLLIEPIKVTLLSGHVLLIFPRDNYVLNILYQIK